MRRSVATAAQAALRFQKRPMMPSANTFMRPFTTTASDEPEALKFPHVRYRLQIFNVPKEGNSEEFANSMKELNLPRAAQVELKKSRKGKPTGTANLHFDTEEEANAAAEILQGREWKGKTLSVKMHAPPRVDQGDTDFLTDLRTRLALLDQSPEEDPVMQQLLNIENPLTPEEFAELPVKLRTAGIDPREKKRLKALKMDSTPIITKMQHEARERYKAMEQREDLFLDVNEGKRPPHPDDFDLVDKKRRPLYPRSTEPDLVGRPEVKLAGFDTVQQDKVPWQANIIAIDRTCKVIKGGIQNSFRALVTVGNGNGVGGFGVAKGSDPMKATERALREARRNVVVVHRYKKTSFVHDLEGRHNSCKVVVRAVPPGYGMRAGRIIEATLLSMGISDATAKAHGRRKPLAVVQALFKALARHSSLGEIARARGRRVVELEWRKASTSSVPNS